MMQVNEGTTAYLSATFSDKTGNDPVSLTEKTHAVMLATVLGKSITDTNKGVNNEEEGIFFNEFGIP